MRGMSWIYPPTSPFPTFLLVQNLSSKGMHQLITCGQSCMMTILIISNYSLNDLIMLMLILSIPFRGNFQVTLAKTTVDVFEMLENICEFILRNRSSKPHHRKVKGVAKVEKTPIAEKMFWSKWYSCLCIFELRTTLYVYPWIRHVKPYQKYTICT